MKFVGETKCMTIKNCKEITSNRFRKITARQIEIDKNFPWKYVFPVKMKIF